MGKCTPYILEGDGELDIHSHIIRLFGLDLDEYFNELDFNDILILTRDIFENRLESVFKELELNTQYIDYNESTTYYLLILGYFILKKGAEIPDDIRCKIAEVANPEHDVYKFKTEKMNDERKLFSTTCAKKF